MKKDETIHKLLTEQRESSAKKEDKVKVIQCLEDTVKELKKKITDLNEKVCECKVEVKTKAMYRPAVRPITFDYSNI